jgi:hypothetical protein
VVEWAGQRRDTVAVNPPGAGYSGTPLAKKLGMKSAMRVFVVDAPPQLRELLADAPPDLVWLDKLATFELALAFARSMSAWTASLAMLEPKLATAGMIWAAWPKRSSGVATDLSEGAIRDAGLAAGLVDVKVCAIDATWSGLKFVRRVRDRWR